MSKQPIGEFIASLRKDAGLTQQDVADKLNISDRTLSSWETDRTEPDLSSLTALAELYGVTADEILRGKRSEAPDFSVEATEHVNPLVVRFAGFLSALKKLTALGVLCAAVVLVGFILLLYVPAPMWVDFILVFIGAVGNAVFIMFIYRKTSTALLNVSDEEKNVTLAVKHKALICVIFNSLAYIAWVMVILMCYWFVSYYDMHPVGTVDQNYDLYTAAAVIICSVLGGALLLCALASNLAHINCLGNERQKSAAKSNVKLFKIICAFGAAFVALCLIPYAVFYHVSFTETEEYFTVKGVDEVYKTFQTYKLNNDRVLTDRDSNDEFHVTIIPKGEYYLDFQSETYVEATAVYYQIFPEPVYFYDLGNNFYARYYNREKHLNDLVYADNLSSVDIYYLKDGVKLEDISLDKDYSDYFTHLQWCDVIKFTSPEGEQLSAVCVPYYFKRDKGYYDEEGWRYDYDCYYNIRDELVLNRNGDEYSYCLITYRNYTPLATLVLLGSICVTACVCTAVQLIKRKKITYGF